MSGYGDLFYSDGGFSDPQVPPPPPTPQVCHIGASVQCCALRVSALNKDGTISPSTASYVTDAIQRVEATPIYVSGADVEVLDVTGLPVQVYKGRDVFKRYDLSLDFLRLDPDFEGLLIGGLKFLDPQGYSIGLSAVAAQKRPPGYGVSVELWSKHILSGDQDPVFPYIWWVFPRTFWSASKETWDGNVKVRTFPGWATNNPNWEQPGAGPGVAGPDGLWQWDSTRCLAYQYSAWVPTPTCIPTPPPSVRPVPPPPPPPPPTGSNYGRGIYDKAKYP